MNNKKLWFKAKRFGWGWQPSSWQGWLITAIYIIGILNFFMEIGRSADSVSDTLLAFSPRFILLTAIFLAICYLKGEKPAWHWNGKPRA